MITDVLSHDGRRDLRSMYLLTELQLARAIEQYASGDTVPPLPLIQRSLRLNGGVLGLYRAIAERANRRRRLERALRDCLIPWIPDSKIAFEYTQGRSARRASWAMQRRTPDARTLAYQKGEPSALPFWKVVALLEERRWMVRHTLYEQVLLSRFNDVDDDPVPTANYVLSRAHPILAADRNDGQDGWGAWLGGPERLSDAESNCEQARHVCPDLPPQAAAHRAPVPAWYPTPSRRCRASRVVLGAGGRLTVAAPARVTARLNVGSPTSFHEAGRRLEAAFSKETPIRRILGRPLWSVSPPTLLVFHALCTNSCEWSGNHIYRDFLDVADPQHTVIGISRAQSCVWRMDDAVSCRYMARLERASAALTAANLPTDTATMAAAVRAWVDTDTDNPDAAALQAAVDTAAADLAQRRQVVADALSAYPGKRIVPAHTAFSFALGCPISRPPLMRVCGLVQTRDCD